MRKLIAGPAGVYICDECVDICADIIEEEYEAELDQAIGKRLLGRLPVIPLRIRHDHLKILTRILGHDPCRILTARAA